MSKAGGWNKGLKTKGKYCYCKECSKEFYEYNSRIKEGCGIFCSMKCRDIWKTKSVEFANNVKLGVLKKYEDDPDYKNRISVGTKAGMKKFKLRGKHLHNYNPNITDEDRRNSRLNSEYCEWRLKVYKKYHYTCQKCGKVGFPLVAHHILSYHTHKLLRARLSNGIVLCQKHHIQFHNLYGSNTNRKQLNDYLKKGKEDARVE